MTLDIKAIREANTGTDCSANIHPATVIALCDEVERLRNGMFNIANQSTEPAIQEFARSYLGDKP